jgi:hypothetical protein
VVGHDYDSGGLVHGLRSQRLSDSRERRSAAVIYRSPIYIGGEWDWLVCCRGREVAEGSARGYQVARQDAEAAARLFLYVVPPARGLGGTPAFDIASVIRLIQKY